MIRYYIALSILLLPFCPTAFTQEAKPQASVTTAVGNDGTGSIVVEARGQLPKAPVFFVADVQSIASVTENRVTQEASVSIEVIQGQTRQVTLEIRGKGDVSDVLGDSVVAWSVKTQADKRYLEISFGEEIGKQTATVTLTSARYELPAQVDLAHLCKGSSVGFASQLTIQSDTGVRVSVQEADGFAPLQSNDGNALYSSTNGGRLLLSLSRDGSQPAEVELNDASLTGTVDPDEKSATFRLRAEATVRVPGAELPLLSGRAALSKLPASDNYRAVLSPDSSNYKLVFPREGTFELDIEFAAAVGVAEAGWNDLDFTVAASAVVPLKLTGLAQELDFRQGDPSIVPVHSGEQWTAFLPATGRTRLQWKASRQTGKGKLFFDTTAILEAQVGSGLLRQEHSITYQVLQGELASLTIDLLGPGEVLDVSGANIVGWKVTTEDEIRRLEIALGQPIAGTSQIRVRSQTALGAFPVEVQGLALKPVGSIRHSGYLRLSNRGAVRIEPTSLTGLSQLAPEQFPGAKSEARQSFVYRFPSASHGFSISADRIQPEVNISQLVVYQLSETDRTVSAEIEFDIREAPIRQWDIELPDDYSIVSVTGASVSDYVSSSGTVDGRRNLKVIFSQDVAGRQLISLQLEKNETATAGQWQLPRIEFPGAKSVTGDVGIVGAPGFRIAVETADKLVEKPLSYFPARPQNLQHAFRIREPDWSASMLVELLDRSTQSDVFHLYSLSQGVVYGSSLINYFITGAPLAELRVTVPQSLSNVMVDGQDVRTWRREGDTLVVSLHQPVMGAATLLVTFEERPEAGLFQAAQISPLDVQGERGYIQVVSPMQVELQTLSIPDDLLVLDPLELPAEFRLLSAAPALGTWQYTERPFALNLKVNWFKPGTTAVQVVEYSEAKSRVSADGEQVTDVLYYVKSRGQQLLRIQLPGAPVKLWAASVNGRPVTARQAGDETLIPLPGGTDPNVPVEVSLRLGKPAVDERHPRLALPIVYASVLKTQWNIDGDEQHILLPGAGTVTPPVPVTRPSGLEWLTRRSLVPLVVICLLCCIGAWAAAKSGLTSALGVLALVVATAAAFISMVSASQDVGRPAPLQLSLPVLAAGEPVELSVRTASVWQAFLSPAGLALIIGGIVLLIVSYLSNLSKFQLLRAIAVLALGFGVLLQGDSAGCFFGLLCISIVAFLIVPAARTAMGSTNNAPDIQEEAEQSTDEPVTGVATTLLAFALCAAQLTGFSSSARAEGPTEGLKIADTISQAWNITKHDTKMTATVTATLSGKPGDRFLLLRAPAVLTKFTSKGLRLTKSEIAGALAYTVVIPQVVDEDEEADESALEDTTHDITFEYQFDAVNVSDGIPVLTGSAAIQRVSVQYDEPGWAVVSESAIRISPIEDVASTRAEVLLGPQTTSLSLNPRARDIASEETQFYVEGLNLYMPGPGVVDGRHRLQIRPSQGQVSELTIAVPSSLTVSSVNGPVTSWQFDADTGELRLQIEPSQSQAFVLTIETQRGLSDLPADATLSPLSVAGATGEVGLIAVAFGPEAQPESTETTTLSAVNLSDFDTSLIPTERAALHSVYRYGEQGGEVKVRVAAVEPEIRVLAKQVLSIGEERVVLNINFAAEISRAGVFQLSFLLPDGLEVESLSGNALHHWSEVEQTGQRKIILHLNGKTLGAQTFSLVLAGASPDASQPWTLPRFQVIEAARQTGDLIVQPATGLRLQTVARTNVSESDPRSLGGNAKGALAFRLLQSDWTLSLDIEQLDPWITGQVLHEVTLREGQTRSLLVADFNVENASVRSMQVALPITGSDELKTLRATGEIVSDFVRTSPDSNIWSIKFKRRVVGDVRFQIEFERRGERMNESEDLSPIGFPDTRQLAYFFSVRAGGRLEIDAGTLTQGWQQADWNTVPVKLREAGDRTAPALTLRAVKPPNVLSIFARRHSLADSLKLRVASGSLTTVLSPTGDQLTAVDLKMEVIQRSSLSVGLPADGQLFSIFVNGESVHSVKRADDWQFYILPGLDDQTADVRFVYSVPGDSLSDLQLSSPTLNVPLEDIQWSVSAPKGFELTRSDGNLELVRAVEQDDYNRKSYLSKASGKREVQKNDATQLLFKANELLQAGEQTKARWALNSVANRYALNAAANEDARVQLENLQTQQAIVGLNTRRQRMYLDNSGASVTGANEQLRQAAADNPLLQKDQLNFRPQQLSQLLGGNTSEDNAVLQRIAARLVQHQRTTLPAPQAIIISLPEEGSVYDFSRSVQVAENAPLQLQLSFARTQRIAKWQTAAAIALIVLIAVALATIRKPDKDTAFPAAQVDAEEGQPETGEH